MKEQVKEFILSKCLHFCIQKNSQYTQIDNSSIYLFDLRELVLHPLYGKMSATLIWQKIRPYSIRMLFGKGAGAVPLMVLIQQVAKEMDGVDVDILICRDRRKTNNRQRLVEGVRLETAPRAMFIDDLTNTGNTYKQCLAAIEAEGIPIRVVGAAGIVDMWSFTGTRKIAAQNKSVEYIFKRHDLGLSRVTPTSQFIKNLKTQISTENNFPSMDIKSPPVIDESGIYWATDENKVYCLDTITWEIRWVFDAPVADDYHEKGIVNKLLVTNDSIFFNSYNGISYKVNKTTGNIIWSTKASRWIHSSSTLSMDGSKVYFSTESRDFDTNSPSGDLVCLSSESGEEIWRYKTSDLAPCTPIVSNTSVVFANNENKIYNVDASCGKLIWSLDLLGSVKGRAVIHNDVCYATTENGFLYAINMFSGHVIKMSMIARSIRHNFLTVYNDYLIVLDGDGLVKAYDTSLSLKWISRVRGSLFWYPAIWNDRIYVTTKDGYCFCLDGLTGKKLGLFYVGSDGSTTIMGAAPAVKNNIIAFHTTNKGLFVYELVS